MTESGLPAASALELFARLPEGDVDALFRIGVERLLRTGDAVLVAGAAPSFLYVVLDGEAAVLSATEPQEIVNSVVAGGVLGEIGYLDGSPASMTVVAVVPCRLLEVPLDALRDLVERDPSFGTRFHRALGAAVSSRIRRGDELRRRGAVALAPDPRRREQAARVAAANIGRLRGRQNHPSLLLENREDYAAVVARGLPQTRSPATVAVVGAGLAGLSAAFELQRAGHHVVVIEASRRVGGRCFTLRAPFAPGYFGEAGAMRFPSSHKLLIAYLERFGIPTRRFTSTNPDGLFVFRGRPQRMGDVLADAQSEPSRVRRLWLEAIRPLAERFRAVAAQGGNAWPALVEELNELTLRDFLVQSGWPEDDIAAFGLVGLGLGGYGALMNMGFLELLRLSLLGVDDDLHEIAGGADQLPRALLEEPPCRGRPPLAAAVRYGAVLRGIRQDEGSGVTLAVETAVGRETLTADYVVLTVPFPLLRFVDAQPAFSPGKVRAINELHYFSATKIFLQFRRRFWEQDEPRCAGMVVTDLPIRALYLPHPDAGHQDGRGVVLASYTWESEARVWEALSPDDRVREALRQVALVFPAAPSEFEVGASVTWNDPKLFAGGAFAQYAPGQRGVLYADIVAPEGRIHFAGEHTSFEHGWMEGAIESGIREAVAVHARAAEERPAAVGA